MPITFFIFLLVALCLGQCNLKNVVLLVNFNNNFLSQVPYLRRLYGRKSCANSAVASLTFSLVFSIHFPFAGDVFKQVYFTVDSKLHADSPAHDAQGVMHLFTDVGHYMQRAISTFIRVASAEHTDLTGFLWTNDDGKWSCQAADSH